jgi:eukaryotic-like serine/threonine-protein kinase
VSIRASALRSVPSAARLFELRPGGCRIIQLLMTLSAGMRLGPYEILSPLGAGGMGEVYKARDPRLDRIVAIKVLAAHLAADEGSRARFEREAHLVAALEHPNICVVHDVGRQDGADFLVMEYLEGETLAERLTKGPLPIDHALRVAAQIADAVDKAHRQGIIHRDLKPGNVMLAKTGVKVLDFGLAKLRPVFTASDGLSGVATQRASLTGHGTILGTLHYMAPEQLEGDEADARTDIFAFGALLHEMTTGKRAFDDQSPAGLIAAVLEHEPTPATTLQPAVPRAIDMVVKNCLEKEPAERWQSMHDVLLELKSIADSLSHPLAQAPSTTHRWSRERLAWSLVCFLLAAIGVLVLRHATGASDDRTTVVAQVAVPDGMVFDADVPTMSPDGRQLAFAGDVAGRRTLWIRQLDSLTNRSLPGTDGAYLPFWSPDSRFIAFWTDGKLKKIAAAGGAVLTLADAASFGGGGTWNGDGVILFNATDTGPVFSTSESGGAPTAVTALEASAGERRHRHPHFLPDGRHFLYVVESDNRQRGGVYVASLESKQTKRLLDVQRNIQYAPSGHLLFVREGALMAQPFDLATLEIRGTPSVIAQQISVSFGVAPFSASGNGVVVYKTTESDMDLVWFTRAGGRISTVAERAGYSQIDLSPDEQNVAVQIGGDIWIIDLGTEVRSRLTFDTVAEVDPVWSPDGRKVLFASRRNQTDDLHVKPLTGEAEEILLDSDESKFPEDWSSDGRFIIYLTFTGQTVYALPLFGDRKPIRLLDSPFLKNEFHFSPDGRWVAYQSEESGRMEVYIVSFPDFGNKRQVSTSGGVQALWRKDGEELFYLRPDGTVMSVAVKLGVKLEAGMPRPLFQTRINVLPWFDQYAVTGDGQKFLVIEPPDKANAINLLLNWPAAVKTINP